MTASFRPLPFLSEARAEQAAGPRLRALRQAAQRAREAFTSEGAATALATCDLVSFPYPTVFAFSGAARSPAPYVMVRHRMQVVRFQQEGTERVLLFNPSDYERGHEAPFFKALREKYGTFVTTQVMTRRHGTVQAHLEALGLTPEDVDYLAFDHLKAQDVRRWLGGDGQPAYFPRARLLVQRAEWDAVRCPHPLERVWYVPEGTGGVPPERVELLSGDTWLGQGVALLSTPGHSPGNMSLAVATADEVFVMSENGVATESYTPLQSTIPGVRTFAEQMGWEVVLNGNTRENSLEQYSSMIVEKVFAGRARADGGFVNVHPSSLLTRAVMAPGLAPTLTLPPPTSGAFTPAAASRHAA
ncbi:hypothetical protein [Archangium primigenium]|uniref:hypothetical protein n=1 Tax=[Archangium] primigenium TaxID=2792470 RepID=UPI00195BF899|nr:hypothetical protein [Archangium primigenium]MBM7117744.1 hypothetical protein [Archangium primigenium]